ncbi:PaaX family transcriptional regulator [Nitriliruptor alkaliphilus]|uniref:PaaX family transcriptional regulator n=1 Tax=Nitriliruptor alkaliphilus TaxID=427918 RepID=UPI001B80966B|nr:PaaX family transcriptional regulator C-terminal domain-containing protein [Nitriliruptor alkaliphilus]
MKGWTLRPRSLVIDLFANYVRYHGGATSAQALLQLMEPFDVTAQVARVTLSRMKQQGWLSTTRHGRASWYELTDMALRELDDGRERIFTRHSTDPWDGAWTMAIYHVPEEDRQIRQWLRTRLAWLGFGPLAPSTWLSPRNRRADVLAAMGDHDVDAQVDLLEVRTGDLAKDRDLARRCWDLGHLNDGYSQFIDHYTARFPAYEARELRGADALVEHIELVHAYRKFPFEDPDLPIELLPPDWNGLRAHELFLQVYQLLLTPATEYFRAVHEPHPSPIAT